MIKIRTKTQNLFQYKEYYYEGKNLTSIELQLDSVQPPFCPLYFVCLYLLLQE